MFIEVVFMYSNNTLCSLTILVQCSISKPLEKRQKIFGSGGIEMEHLAKMV